MSIFKVSSKTHLKIRKFFKALYAVSALSVCIFLLLAVGERYQTARFILADYTPLTVHLVLEDIEESSGRRSRSVTYTFSYDFQVNGQTYYGRLETSEKYGEELFEKGLELEIAYSNLNPSYFDRLSLLQRQAQFWGSLFRWVLSCMIVLVLTVIIYAMTIWGLFDVKQEKEDAGNPPAN